jgi:hypothetical protein
MLIDMTRNVISVNVYVTLIAQKYSEYVHNFESILCMVL